MRRPTFLGVFAGALVYVLVSAGAASAQCQTLVSCVQEEVEQQKAEVERIAGETQQTAEDEIAEMMELLEPTLSYSRTLLEEAQRGKEVVCELEGRWSASTGVASGPARCARFSYASPSDPRNGVSEGTFSIALVKRYVGGGSGGCAFALTSPDYGEPNAYGSISQPGATYRVLLGGAGHYGVSNQNLGVDGNNVGPGTWYDAEHNTGANQIVYVLNAEPVTIIQGNHSSDCSDSDLFVNAVVVMAVL